MATSTVAEHRGHDLTQLVWLGVNPNASHVLFVVNTYPPRLGGLEQHVSQLATHMVRLGHAASVVTLGPPIGESMEEGVAVRRLRGRFAIASVISFPPIGTARRIAAAYRESGVSAVSTHTRFFPMSFVGLSVARRLGVPVVHTEHGSGFVRGVSPLVALGSRLVDLTVGRRILRRADAVLAVSESVAAFVLRLAGRHAEIFYNAIEAPPESANPVPATSRFVFVGRLVPGKGWDAFLDAIAALKADGRLGGASAMLLGDGPDAAAARARIDALGLAGTVELRGHVPRAEVDRALAGAVLVNPTRLAEGFQTSLLEALAAGSQMVTYPVPGAEALLKEGAPVRIAQRNPSNLAEQMSAALADPMPAFPREGLARWTWPQRARQYMRVVDRLLAH
ncbi:glycosyltransferase family 4 protein [Leifsonella bigeumensis]